MIWGKVARAVALGVCGALLVVSFTACKVTKSNSGSGLDGLGILAGSDDIAGVLLWSGGQFQSIADADSMRPKGFDSETNFVFWPCRILDSTAGHLLVYWPGADGLVSPHGFALPDINPGIYNVNLVTHDPPKLVSRIPGKIRWEDAITTDRKQVFVGENGELSVCNLTNCQITTYKLPAPVWPVKSVGRSGESVWVHTLSDSLVTYTTTGSTVMVESVTSCPVQQLVAVPGEHDIVWLENRSVKRGSELGQATQTFNPKSGPVLHAVYDHLTGKTIAFVQGDSDATKDGMVFNVYGWSPTGSSDLIFPGWASPQVFRAW